LLALICIIPRLDNVGKQVMIQLIPEHALTCLAAQDTGSG
jgi:hypothetical protein